MPELPEMETYRNLLSERIINQEITSVVINREKSINVSVDLFATTLLANKVISIERRGKYLLFNLENEKCLLLHLMLGGLMYFGTSEDQPDRSKQIIISFSKSNLYFIGLRLGFLHLFSKDDAEQELSKLGPNPLSPDFTFESFEKLIHKRKGILKTTLPNQSFLAGIGNCYSDEICFEAKLLPTRKLNELNNQERENLFSAIKSVLVFAIKSGGYIEMPLYKDDTLTGGYNNRCKVYDRDNENCLRCGSKLEKKVISSRKTYFCPSCQK
ncbi:DNA-formamidopyrimidine glycosylase [Litchfieldia alkalitelluris]|uniref:DNA-formamidopyrimidine glycosylase n=1 Tax=Litchfieldia alkalitelluris TaxID=304268 RepID=UPI000997DAFF|nr:DNA-formamidopyrimidine glycosylase [Litchfieldia alkalitelluris]